MKKSLILGTILLTSALLIGGVYFPNYPLMWLAGTSMSFEVVRAVLIVLLGILLFSNPPRALMFRYLIGGMAVSLIVVIGILTATYKINVIDIIVFSEIAVIFGIEALEAPDEYPNPLSVKRSGAMAK